MHKRFKQILLFLPLLAMGACFDLRDAAPPDAASNWTPPNRPEILISNFTLAVNELNLVNYERSFRPDVFTFIADPNVAANNQGLFSNWTFQNHELEYIRNMRRLLLPGSPPANLVFTNSAYNNLSADSVEFIADYNLSINLADTSLRTSNFKGNLAFTMARNAFNEWAIGRWRDTKTTSEPCWSELKQKYATR